MSTGPYGAKPNSNIRSGALEQNAFMTERLFALSPCFDASLRF